jgi:hypothetical protein
MLWFSGDCKLPAYRKKTAKSGGIHFNRKLVSKLPTILKIEIYTNAKVPLGL